MKSFDLRTMVILISAIVIGVASAAFAWDSTANVRGDTTVRPLVWTIFATPFLLFLSWAWLRRAEIGLAAFCCLCLYFFTPFVAARIETIIDPVEAAVIGGKHNTYFISVMVLHAIVGSGLALWRARHPLLPQQPTSVTKTGSRSAA